MRIATAAAVVAVAAALAGCGSETEDTAPSTARASASSSPTAAPAATTAAPVTTSTTSSPPAAAAPPPAAPRAPFPPSDPRCGPAAPDLVATVAAGLNRADYRLTNGTVLSEGRYVYFGATIVDASGAVKSRSDVWVLRDGVPFASTGGARNNSRFPKASTVLNVGPGDAPVAAVDNCVANLALGR
ncbi:DUF2510 domain-containing protein [Nocardia sp. NPDC057455]|uniref:DUF2510 domain-containing protein n=1 Tax=Nocardia sp. NPDC057455 TaxID=3346138 RepID=UPI00366C4C5B